MESQPWLNRVRERLVRQLLPPSYVQRFVEELSDHLEDVKEDGMDQNSSSRLGDPEQVADTAVAAYRRRSFRPTSGGGVPGVWDLACRVAGCPIRYVSASLCLFGRLRSWPRYSQAAGSLWGCGIGGCMPCRFIADRRHSLDPRKHRLLPTYKTVGCQQKVDSCVLCDTCRTRIINLLLAGRIGKTSVAFRRLLVLALARGRLGGPNAASRQSQRSSRHRLVVPAA